MRPAHHPTRPRVERGVDGHPLHEQRRVGQHLVDEMRRRAYRQLLDHELHRTRFSDPCSDDAIDSAAARNRCRGVAQKSSRNDAISATRRRSARYRRRFPSTRAVTSPASRSCFRCWLAADLGQPRRFSQLGRGTLGVPDQPEHRPAAGMGDGAQGLVGHLRDHGSSGITAGAPWPPGAGPGRRHRPAPGPGVRRARPRVPFGHLRHEHRHAGVDQLAVQCAVLIGRGGEIPRVDQVVHERARRRQADRPREARAATRTSGPVPQVDAVPPGRCGLRSGSRRRWRRTSRRVRGR